MSYLISLILLLLPAYLIRFSVFRIPTTVLEILIYAIFLYGLWQAKKDGFRPIRARIFLPISLLILALIISTIISPDKRVALGEFKGFFIDPLLVFWLIYQFAKKEDLKKFFLALFLSGGFVACQTIVLKFLGSTTPDGRVIGIFGYSPNYLALFLAPITVLLIASIPTTDYRLPLNNKFLRLAIVGILSAIYLLAIYFSGSRGGILAIAAGLGVFFILHFWQWIRHRLSSQIIIGILIMMAIYTSWVLFRPDFNVSPENGGRIATSNNLRFEIWQTSIELGRKQPILGVGLGNFQNAFRDLTKNRGNFPEYITPMALTPHNIFLMFWLSTGILGLVAFVWLLIEFFREGLKKLKLPMAAVLMAMMASIVVYGLVESSIWKNDLSIIFWVMWGLIWLI